MTGFIAIGKINKVIVVPYVHYIVTSSGHEDRSRISPGSLHEVAAVV